MNRIKKILTEGWENKTDEEKTNTLREFARELKQESYTLEQIETIMNNDRFYNSERDCYTVEEIEQMMNAR